MLTVDGVTFAYDARPVVDGLALEVREGELVGVVGRNGSGKTTLMRLISGLLRPASGAVRVDGTDLRSLKPGKRARLVSVVPQNPQLPLGFTVLDLVLMGRNPHLKLLEQSGPRDREVATRAMRETDTYHLAGRTLETLSGGERQRAVVAMALAQESPVVLLDEPTASLDLAHQVGVMDLVSQLRERHGVAVLAAMHDLTLAAQYCSRLVMLADGRAFAEGAPEAVLTRENISEVYGADVFILPHPQRRTPVVLPVSHSRSDPPKAGD